MSSRYDQGSSGSGSNYDGPKWGKAFGIILAIVLAIVVVGGVVIYNYGHSLFSLTSYVAAGSQQQQTLNDNYEQHMSEEEAAAKAQKETESETESETTLGTKVSDSELQEIQKNMAAVDSNVATASDENVYNVLLVGVDRRDKTWNGNSDSMILVSINYNAKRISMISLMRDTYVNIPDVGYAKLNNAYARGGGELLCETISDNYNIDLTRYAAVDFEDMITIVDALGGVDLEWTDAEVAIANGYIEDMCNTLNIDASEHLLPGGGVYHCDGVQAVAYARNRFVGNSDYARTERQRYVLSQMLAELKQMNVAQLMSFMQQVLPLVTHNIQESDIWNIVTRAPELFTYTFVKDRVPYDNMYDVIYVDGQDMLVPYWEQTIQQMHETIYGDGKVSDNSDNDEETRTDDSGDVNQDWLDFMNEVQSEKEAGTYTESSDGSQADGSAAGTTSSTSASSVSSNADPGSLVSPAA